MKDKYTATPSDPWWVDPTDTLAVLKAVNEHVRGSHACTHGQAFTYDFCPVANGILTKAILHLERDTKA